MSILPFFKRSSVPIEAPQKPEALPDAPSAAPDAAAVKAYDYLCNILGLNDVQAKILNVVMTEVSGVRSDIDNNFVELSTRFTHLAQVSRDQTQLMQELASNTDTIQVGDKALPIGEVAETMGHTLSEFVEKIVFMSSRSVNMVYTLDDVMAQIEQVEASIKSIDRINTQTNMLAINAKIEAVHAGELGAGFGIVADEVRELARSVGTLSSDLKSRIGIISQGLHKGYDLLREIAEVDTSGQNLAVNQSINNMMRALVDQSVSLKTMLETSADAAESITGDISEAIVRMQFQDRATQRLETAVTAVQTLVDAMGKADTEARSTLSLVNGTAYGEALSEDVLAQCTLGSVHDSLLTSLGRVKTGDASLRGHVHVQAAGDVELF